MASKRLHRRVCSCVLWDGTYQEMLRQKVVLQDYKRLEKEKGAKIPDNIVDDYVDKMIRQDRAVWRGPGPVRQMAPGQRHHAGAVSERRAGHDH